MNTKIPLHLLTFAVMLLGAIVDPKSLSPILVSIRQAAELLAVCPRTITNLLAAKKLKGRKLGRRTLLSYRELLEFSRHDHATTPEQPQRRDHVTATEAQ
jgi:excisionase family DNA binding protein